MLLRLKINFTDMRLGSKIQSIYLSKCFFFVTELLYWISQSLLAWIRKKKNENDQKQPPEVFRKKNIFRNFAKFTGKHLCQSPFFNKIVGLKLETLLKQRIWHTFFLVFYRTPPDDCFCITSGEEFLYVSLFLDVVTICKF